MRSCTLFPGFLIKKNKFLHMGIVERNKEIEARRTSTTARTSSENIILRFRNHFFVTCLRCPQTRELKQTYGGEYWTKLLLDRVR